MKAFWLAACCAATPVLAQEARDPLTVWLPAGAELQLKLGSEAPFEHFGEAFDAIAPSGAVPILGAGTDYRIRAASDRARVFLLYLQYDLDGDGAVSRSEYDTHAEVTWGADLDDYGRGVLDREWTQGDRDGDGVISAEEMRAAALERHPVPEDRPLTQIEEAILGMDLDNDGFVYWDEVERVLRARMPG